MRMGLKKEVKRLKIRIKQIENQLYPEQIGLNANIQFKGTARIAEEALNLATKVDFDCEIIDFFKQVFYGEAIGSFSKLRRFQIYHKQLKKYIKELLENDEI